LYIREHDTCISEYIKFSCINEAQKKLKEKAKTKKEARGKREKEGKSDDKNKTAKGLFSVL
jgi:hypothetical protein